MNIPFDLIDWEKASTEEMPGETGLLKIKKVAYDKLAVRILECSSNFKLDHWCFAGHIAYCISGACTLVLKNGEVFLLEKGMSFCVSDNQPAHQLLSKNGATIFIVDGDFLTEKTL